MYCRCGGIINFCKEFKEGKIREDTHTFICTCGDVIFISNGTLWYMYYPCNYYPVDLNSIT